MNYLTSYLPQSEGLLPQWILFIAVVSISNSIQAYSTLRYTARVYNPTSIDPPAATPKHITELTSRLFGTWTLLTSMVRLFGAYNIHDRSFYQLVFMTYLVAFLHFTSEWFVFRTTRWGLPLAFPVFISTITMTWMSLQWDYYVKV